MLRNPYLLDVIERREREGVSKRGLDREREKERV